MRKVIDADFLDQLPMTLRRLARVLELRHALIAAERKRALLRFKRALEATEPKG